MSNTTVRGIMKRLLTPIALLAVLMVGAPAPAAHAASYKYSAPVLNSLQVVDCNPHDWASVKVTWTPSKTSGGGYTSVNYSRSTSPWLTHLSWYPAEYGTQAEVYRATTTTIKNLKPGAKYSFRVYAGKYDGERQSKYSNVRTITMPTC